jgi:hypothetical protein
MVCLCCMHHGPASRHPSHASECLASAWRLESIALRSAAVGCRTPLSVQTVINAYAVGTGKGCGADPADRGREKLGSLKARQPDRAGSGDHGGFPDKGTLTRSAGGNGHGSHGCRTCLANTRASNQPRTLWLGHYTLKAGQGPCSSSSAYSILRSLTVLHIAHTRLMYTCCCTCPVTPMPSSTLRLTLHTITFSPPPSGWPAACHQHLLLALPRGCTLSHNIQRLPN